PGVLFFGRNEGNVYVGEWIELFAPVAPGGNDCKTGVARPGNFLVGGAAGGFVDVFHHAVDEVRMRPQQLTTRRRAGSRVEQLRPAIPKLSAEPAYLVLHGDSDSNPKSAATNCTNYKKRELVATASPAGKEFRVIREIRGKSFSKCRSRGSTHRDAGAAARDPLRALSCSESTCQSHPW